MERLHVAVRLAIGSARPLQSPEPRVHRAPPVPQVAPERVEAPGDSCGSGLVCREAWPAVEAPAPCWS